LASAPDVTVIGGGVFGLACAWEMARRGARVRLEERARIGAGASGGVVGALAPHAPEGWTPLKAFQLESLLAAEAFWSGVAAASGAAPGYARTGRLQPVPDEAALVRAEARAAAAAQLWGGRATWRILEAAEAGAWAPASATGLLVEDTLSARLHPARACAALAAALRAAGGEIALGETIGGARGGAPGDGAENGPILWATGADGLAALSADLGREAGRGIKGQAALLRLDRRGAPQIYAGGLHVVPHADGTVAVGSTTERDFDDAEATDGQLDAVIARARAAVPALGDAPVVRRWAGLRPRARTRRPVLGPWPGRPGHFVANGGFKIGFGLAPAVARVMAELILEGRDAIPEGCRVEDLG
jgi:glycine/D-amino acid oxidase-like deaminating enzyme